MKKIYDDDDALEGFLRDDMLIAAGGFGLCGIPELLLAARQHGSVCPGREHQPHEYR